MKTDSPYIMTYKHGFVDIACKLQQSELKIFSVIFNNTNFGNNCYMKQVDIAKKLDMDKANLSRRIKRITDLDLMRKNKKGFMLNPEYFLLGSMDDRTKLLAIYASLAGSVSKAVPQG